MIKHLWKRPCQMVIGENPVRAGELASRDSYQGKAAAATVPNHPQGEMWECRPIIGRSSGSSKKVGNVSFYTKRKAHIFLTGQLPLCLLPELPDLLSSFLDTEKTHRGTSQTKQTQGPNIACRPSVCNLRAPS